MTEVLEFIFSSFWTLAGTVILIAAITHPLGIVVAAFASGSR